MQKMAKAAITLATSLVGSWIGAAFAHGSWSSAPSIILGIIGLGVGYLLARWVDNYIEG